MVAAMAWSTIVVGEGSLERWKLAQKLLEVMAQHYAGGIRKWWARATASQWWAVAGGAQVLVGKGGEGKGFCSHTHPFYGWRR
jgi:hypothetical protein